MTIAKRIRPAHSPRDLMRRRWQSMIEYCTNPKRKTYKYVGALGIKVCERWLNSFEDYLQDVGLAPGANMFLERVDKKKDFEPGNVRWSTKKELVNNTSLVTRVVYAGVEMTLKQASELSDLDYQVIVERVTRGWTIEAALETPLETYIERLVIYEGVSYTLSELSAKVGLPASTLYARIFVMKWSLEDAITRPKKTRARSKNARQYEFRGETHYLDEWSKILGIGHSTLAARLAKCKYDPEIAFTAPVIGQKKVKPI